MLYDILFGVAFIAACCGVLSAVCYPFICSGMEKHLASPRPTFEQDQEGFAAWHRKRWAWERKRTRFALVGLASYAFGIFSMIPELSAAHLENGHHTTIVMIVLTLSIWVVTIRSSIHNSREFSLDLKQRYPLS